MPERCDGCGRTASTSGMRDTGWAVRVAPANFAGVYCLDCASALRLVPWWATCSECGRASRDEEQAEREGWRYLLDSAGELHPYCPRCLSGATSG
ncbi:MAG TPA: hypothetical protein VEH79_02190 [Gaiellaceae bacterium]|nr:hypothetical protein [Gaiellaceae bacterium]